MGFGADIKGNAGPTTCTTKAGLAEGTAAATIKTLAPNGAGTDFAIDGIGYHKADTDSIAVTAHPVQAADTKCMYLVQIDSAGVLSTKKGEEVLTVDLTAGKTALQTPDPDDNRCPLGDYKIATVAVTYTNGTTDMSAAGITTTFRDFIGGMPLAPLTS